MTNPRGWSVLWAVAVVSVLAVGSSWADEAQPKQSADLTYETFFEWNWDLPAAGFRPVTNAIPAAGVDGGFRVALKGTRLAVDTTGDGETDTVVRGPRSLVQLRAKSADGGTVAMALRLAFSRGKWNYAVAGAQTTKIDGVTVRLFDQNGNGSYGDAADAIVVGDSLAGSMHSSVIAVNGKLYDIEVDELGRKLTYEAHTGETGKIDVAKNYASAGKLSSVVLQALEGYSFQVAAGSAMTVPVGTYRLIHGTVEKGRERATIVGGRSKAWIVAKDETLAPEWGGPLQAEFQPIRRGDRLRLSPRALRLFGRAGEEYVGFNPEGRSPEFAIFHAESRKKLMTAKFAVSG